MYGICYVIYIYMMWCDEMKWNDYYSVFISTIDIIWFFWEVPALAICLSLLVVSILLLVGAITCSMFVLYSNFTAYLGCGICFIFILFAAILGLMQIKPCLDRVHCKWEEMQEEYEQKSSEKGQASQETLN